MKALKAFIKPFEAPERSVKIKIEVSFFSLSGIRTGRVNTDWLVNEKCKLWLSKGKNDNSFRSVLKSTHFFLPCLKIVKLLPK